MKRMTFSINLAIYYSNFSMYLKINSAVKYHFVPSKDKIAKERNSTTFLINEFRKEDKFV